MSTPQTEKEVLPETKRPDSLEASELEPETLEPKFDAAPDGGVQAWLTVTGTAFIFFCGLGYANSFGVFQEYFRTHQLQDKSPDDVAWIGSLAAFLQIAAGAIGGPLFDRYGAIIIRPAAIVFVFCVMMISLCKEYWQFMLAQGVLLGISSGFMLFPAMGAVSQYFDKKRAAALGVAISGSSIGGVVLPIVFSKMLNDTSLGFGWSVRIMGFVFLPLLGFASIVIRARLPPRTTTFFIPSAFKEASFTSLIVASFFLFLGMMTPLFYLPTYAVSRGMSATLASYLLAIVNGASTFGRVIPGILADKLGRLNILATGGICTGIVIFCLNEAKSTAALVVYSIAFGLSSGTLISGVSVAFTSVPKDPRSIGTYMGMGMSVASIATLIGPPINGRLVASYGGFSEVAIFSGTVCLVGGLIALASKFTTPEGFWSKR